MQRILRRKPVLVPDVAQLSSGPGRIVLVLAFFSALPVGKGIDQPGKLLLLWPNGGQGVLKAAFH